MKSISPQTAASIMHHAAGHDGDLTKNQQQNHYSQYNKGNLNELERLFLELSRERGVCGVMIITRDGVPVRSTIEDTFAQSQYAYVVSTLVNKANLMTYNLGELEQRQYKFLTFNPPPAAAISHNHKLVNEVFSDFSFHHFSSSSSYHHYAAGNKASESDRRDGKQEDRSGIGSGGLHSGHGGMLGQHRLNSAGGGTGHSQGGGYPSVPSSRGGAFGGGDLLGMGGGMHSGVPGSAGGGGGDMMINHRLSLHNGMPSSSPRRAGGGGSGGSRASAMQGRGVLHFLRLRTREYELFISPAEHYILVAVQKIYDPAEHGQKGFNHRKY